MQESLIFTEIQLFFFNKHSSYCCEPLVNFQSSEKVNLDSLCVFVFTSIVMAFMKE